jgi:hypothetical protein
MPERNVEEQEPGAGEVEEQAQCRWGVVQSQGPAGLGGLLCCVEEGVEAAAVAEGDRVRSMSMVRMPSLRHRASAVRTSEADSRSISPARVISARFLRSWR